VKDAVEALDLLRYYKDVPSEDVLRRPKVWSGGSN
jgi:hypothetical protein